MCLKAQWNDTEDDFTRLEEKIKEKERESKPLTDKEKERIELELDIIKKTNTASVFLLYYDIMLYLKDLGAVFHGIMHCSYLCYLLGLTKVNPLDYDLPFERFFHEKKRYFPLINIAVPFGMQEKAAAILSQCKPKFEYRLEEAGIKEYRHFTEEEIYQKTLDYFTWRGISMGRKYQGEKRAEMIFSKTDGRYIYQEQFYEICERILGVSNKQADEFRKKLAFRKMEDREAIKQFFCWKLDEEGAGLFDYIYFGHIYVVSKAYIIGLLFLDFTI